MMLAGVDIREGRGYIGHMKTLHKQVLVGAVSAALGALLAEYIRKKMR